MSSVMLNEFLQSGEEEEVEVTPEVTEVTEAPEVAEEAPVEEVEPEEPEVNEVDVELDVQKAVVSQLAAEKAELNEVIVSLRKDNYQLRKEIDELKVKADEMKTALGKVGDVLLMNTEAKVSNQVAVLERPLELKDRFEGETHDQLIEILREERERCEKDGRCRRGQIVEGILVANESLGTLAKRREALEKLFSDNQNILNGPVINELEKLGISIKEGETYLLPSEILKRNY